MKKKGILLMAMAVAIAVIGVSCNSAEPRLPPAEWTEPEVKGYSLIGLHNEIPLPPQAYRAQEAYLVNEDVVGWLTIPDTEVDGPVLLKPGNNEYYLRRGLDKHYDYNGSYFADYRSQYTSGTSENIPRNTVIYGNSESDDPTGMMFSQLKKYKDYEFAKQHPYIYFSTLEEDMVWEVFAIFVTTIDVPYNNNLMPEEEYSALLEMVKSESIYRYEIIPDVTDKIITLSTVDYQDADAKTIGSNNRFVIMAKWIPADQATKEHADLIKILT